MKTLSYSRRLVSRQEVMKIRRSLKSPSLWCFSHDKRNFYLTFGRKKRKFKFQPFPMGMVKLGREIAREMK